MIGVEIVKDRKLKEPSSDLANNIKTEMFKQGLLMHTCGHYSNVLRFMAPLIIEDDLIEKGISIFEKSVSAVENKK
jgi:4-aminobutyrate aminotransferase-like enzyme